MRRRECPWSQGEKPVPPIILKRLNAAYGLDDPLWRQYIDYLWNVLHGDFGPSFTSRSRTVMDIIGSTFKISFQLGLVSMLIAVATGITLGTIGAIKHNSPIDYITGFIAIAGISTPSYATVSVAGSGLFQHVRIGSNRWLGWNLEHEDIHSCGCVGALPIGGVGAVYPFEHARCALYGLRPNRARQRAAKLHSNHASRDPKFAPASNDRFRNHSGHVVTGPLSSKPSIPYQVSGDISCKAFPSGITR